MVKPFHNQFISYVVTLESLESGQSWDLLCKKISYADNRIDLVVLLDKRGRVIELEVRPDGTNENLTANKREMLFMEFVLQASMNREYDNEFGRINCSNRFQRSHLGWSH